MRAILCTTALSIALVACNCGLAPCAEFTVTDLGILPELDASQSCYATGVNDHGDVAGYCAEYIDGRLRHVAFIWTPTTGMNSLGTGGVTGSLGLAINNARQVVGYTYDDTNPWGSTQAFLYGNGQFERLKTPLASYSVGFSINNAGVITGSHDDDVMLYDHGTLTDVGRLGPFRIEGRGINDQGDVVGLGTIDGQGTEHAFLFSNGELKDLGGLGGKNSHAYGINNLGQIVGMAETTELGEDDRPFYHAAFFGDGSVADISPPNSDYSNAFAINDRGWIVGSYRSRDDYWSTFLYMNGKALDLQRSLVSSSDWSLFDVSDINDHGQIVGSAVGPGNRGYAVLLTPIPEPGSIQLLILSFATALALRHRCHAWH
jgi:probable HAF family extracellular repeat protein